MGRRAQPKRPRPFDAFELGQQQRFVSISDVLGAQDLRTVHLFRGGVSARGWPLISAGETPNADLSDPEIPPPVSCGTCSSARERPWRRAA